MRYLLSYVLGDLKGVAGPRELEVAGELESGFCCGWYCGGDLRPDRPVLSQSSDLFSLAAGQHVVAIYSFREEQHLTARENYHRLAHIVNNSSRNRPLRFSLGRSLYIPQPFAS